jgi:anthranilate phosphoribosyltransferase
VSWPTLLAALLKGESLSADDTSWAMSEIMAGEATSVQMAGFAVALRAKGETAQEVAGLVRVMLDRCTPLNVPVRAVDTCGTGGDRARTVNVSTMAALVVAGAGVPVVKHGNRAASSACGSADLLEELGVVIDLPAAGVLRCVAEAGIGFCFAPVFHPALRHAATARSELGVATFFNFLGPLANPARPVAQAVGVSDLRMAPVVAGVLADRGASALVFRGEDGLDELTTTSVNRVWAVRDGEVRESLFDATDLDLPRSAVQDLRGADAAYNAAVARSVIDGVAGPVRDAVLLNAAAALAAFDGMTGPVEQAIAAALPRAAESVDSGAAAKALARWVDASITARDTP